MCKRTYNKRQHNQLWCPNCQPEAQLDMSKQYNRRQRRQCNAPIVGNKYPCPRCGNPVVYRGGPANHCKPCRLKLNAEQSYRSFLKRPKVERAAVRRRMKDNHLHGGNRQKALERDNYQCRACGTTKDLDVHHIDGSGRGRRNKKSPNSSIANLETVCRSLSYEKTQLYPLSDEDSRAFWPRNDSGTRDGSCRNTVAPIIPAARRENRPTAPCH